MDIDIKTMTADDIPTFTLESNAGGNPADTWATADSVPLSLTVHGYQPQPVFVGDQRGKAAVFGSPILNDKINPQAAAELALANAGNPAAFKQLDGEFLIILATAGSLKLITSRFTSPPFYLYEHGGELIGSFCFTTLWRRLAARGLLEVNTDTFFDMLLFKRILGEKTHAQHTTIIPPASVMSWTKAGMKTERYWLPDFRKKTKMGLKAASAELAERIQNSIRKKTSDGVRPALFISGGMDTRTVLAAFMKTGIVPTCYTVNAFENREVQVAREVCKAVGAPHVYLPFAPNHYDKVSEAAMELVGGMHLPMYMFLGYKEIVSQNADVIFHGHGFDYMFQGMYIPGRSHTLLGRPIPYRTPAAIPGDVVSFFMENISYKLRDPAWMPMMSEADQKAQWQRVREEVQAVYEQAKEVADSPEDRLEYLSFNNFARHYPFGDHWGMNVNLPQRCLTFDNDVYDWYQQLPAHYRFDRRVLRGALRLMNPELCNIINANHRYPAGLSSLQHTLYLLRDSLLVKLKLKSWPNYGSDDDERMGMPLTRMYRSELRHYVDDTIASGRFRAIPYLKPDAVRAYLNGFLDATIPVNQIAQITGTFVAFDYMMKLAGK